MMISGNNAYLLYTWERGDKGGGISVIVVNK